MTEKLPERIPLVISRVPKAVAEMTEAEFDDWADTVVNGMAERHAKITGDSAE